MYGLKNKRSIMHFSTLSQALAFQRAKTIALILGVLIMMGAFLRLWNFTNTLMFQGDQGRDALVVSQIFKAGDPVFIGPGTSVGGMYLGPFYYYFMLPWLWLTYPSPIGPALAVAVVNILTIPLVYLMGKELVGKRSALLGAFFFTFSASAVEFSRFSWNPNLAPTFGLLILFFTFRAVKRSPWYWVAVALSFGLLIQLHYLALLALGGIGLAWLSQVITLTKNKKPAVLSVFMISSLVSMLVFGATLIPLILFDIKHGFVNLVALQKLLSQDKAFSQDNRTQFEKLLNLVSNFGDKTSLVLFRHILSKNTEVSLALGLGMIVTASRFLTKKTTESHGFLLLLAFLIPTLVGMSFYQKEMHLHYFAYLFPIICLLFGSLVATLTRRTLTWPLAILFGMVFLLHNLQTMPLQSLSWTINDVGRTTQVINQHLIPGEKVSLVLLGPSKDLYAQNYRYYLSTTSTPALSPELAPEADTLVVINEERILNVADVPIYEITIFPEKSNQEVYTIANGPQIHIFRKK